MQIASGGFIDVNDSFAQEATIKALDSEEDDVKIASIFVLGYIADVEILIIR